MEIDITLPAPHAAQREIIDSLARFNVIVCGRRFGKTTLGLDLILDDPRRKGALDGYPVAWFAPNAKLFDEVWWEAVKLTKPITSRVDSQKNRIELITGGVIDFWTLHNTDDPGRGRKYGAIFVDEAAVVPSERLRRQWNEAIRPTLTDYGGSASFGSTPKGRGFFKELFDRGNDPEQPNWASFQFPTSANPYIDDEEVEEARGELPRDSFRQEYLAQFVEEFGSVFTGETQFYDAMPIITRTATGCDFAYTSKAGDWTVFIRAGLTPEGYMVLLDMIRVRTSATQWAPLLVDQPHPFAFIGGQEKGIVDFLKTSYGINITTKPASRDKKARATAVADAWNRGEVLAPANEPWVQELELEVRAFTGTADDEHDDIVDALAAAHHALLGIRPATVGVISFGRR